MSNEMNKFSHWLMAQLSEKNMSQSQLARDTGLSRQAIWKYIAKLQAQCDLSQTIFDLRGSSIRFTLRRIAKNAGIPNVHPHRFRHTFAITYLRNGGDVFTLQRLLGHSTLDTTRKYLDIVRDDLQNAHRYASPVDNLKM